MKIIILNLATDVDDTVLGFTTEWINELSHYFDHIYVLSMKVGKLRVNKNISVFPGCGLPSTPPSVDPTM